MNATEETLYTYVTGTLVLVDDEPYVLHLSEGEEPEGLIVYQAFELGEWAAEVAPHHLLIQRESDRLWFVFGTDNWYSEALDGAENWHPGNAVGIREIGVLEV